MQMLGNSAKIHSMERGIRLLFAFLGVALAVLWLLAEWRGWALADLMEPIHVLGASLGSLLLALFTSPLVRGARKMFAPSARTIEQFEKRNRQAMIDRVRHDWIEGILRQSLYRVARIELELTDLPEAVERSLDAVVQNPGTGPEKLPAGTPVPEVFDRAGKELLILGQPGSGKTTLLLELTEQLLKRAEEDDAHPIPVVFNLSTWAVRRKPLAKWLADELNERYEVPAKTAAAWIAAEQVLPLLDGLDEVAEKHSADCVEAINSFRTEHGLLPIAVSSRSQEYEATGRRLRLRGAVEVLPLERGRVEYYLGLAGARLARVRSTLEREPELWELTHTPLMLSVLMLATETVSLSVRALAPGPDSPAKRLFATYVEAMFARGGERHAARKEETLGRMEWLASAMRRQEQTVFYLESLAPEWLPSRSLARAVPWALGLLCGLVFGLVFGLLGRLVGGLVFGLVGGLVLGLVLGLGGGKGLRPTVRLTWSWGQALRGLVRGLVGGLVFGVLMALVSRLVLGGLVAGAMWGLFMGLLFGMMDGLVPGEITTSAKPNAGTRRSARSALWSGAVAAAVVAMAAGAAWAVLASPSVTQLLSEDFNVKRVPPDLLVIFGLLIAFIALLKGGLFCLRHYVVRAFLWRQGLAPWDYVRFLDYAHDRLLLRKVGGGYIFLHRMLLDYFAERYDGTGER